MKKEIKLKNFQKRGGAAAQGHTFALVGMVLSITWMFLPGLCA